MKTIAAFAQSTRADGLFGLKAWGQYLLAALVLALALVPVVAWSAVNSWSGTGPMATGLGNRVIGALAMSPDGLTLYAGNGSGTVLAYETVLPGVTTSTASGTSATGTTLNGSVNAQGGSFSTLFRYGTASGTYGSSVAATPGTVTGSSATAISATLSALVPNTTYYFRAEASGGSTVQGAELTFITLKLAPTASTGAASGVSGTAATLGATVNAQHDSTSISFQYGLTTAYGSTATASPASLATYGDTAISATLGSLIANTLYHYRVVASNSTGTTYGTDQSFTTTAMAPTSTTGAASSVSVAGAVLAGTVNANNASATVAFEYGPTAALGTSAVATPATATGTSATAVGATLSGLNANTQYHYRVTATNSAGTTNGSTLTFTTAPVAPVATAATAVSGTAFSANWGAVSGATKYWLDVATDSGFGSLVGAYSNKDVGNVTTAAVTGLTAGTPYYYRLRADNGATSAQSNTISVTTIATRVVTNTLDSGAGSLRQTIADANAGDTITFAGGLAGSITLASELAISKNLTLNGPGAGSLSISGNNAVRVFSVAPGVTFSLSDLTVTNGRYTTPSSGILTAPGGGGLVNYGTLSLQNCAFTGNAAVGVHPSYGVLGGALNNVTGTATIQNCTFSGNSVTNTVPANAGNGGAIANLGTMTLTNSTLANNAAKSGGGGLYSSGSLDVTNVTIAGNSVTDAAGTGGGMAVPTGTVTLKNALVAGNTAAGGGMDVAGTVTSQGYNLIGNTAGATIGGVTTGNLTGVAAQLGTLANNGGPTQTLALLSGSPAINAGTCSGAPTTDQRGMARPQGGTCDMGAYERGAPAGLSVMGGNGQAALINTAFATPLTARVVDALGVVLDGESVAFAGPGTGAGIAAGGSATTDSAGLASFSATANGTNGSYVVVASIQALSANFNLTNGVVSSNANLGGLVLSSGTLTPAFAAGTTGYTASVPNAVATITVTPTVADNTASVKVNGTAVASGSASGAIALSVGANAITVLVTAQDTSSKTYSVVVTRASATVAPPPGPSVPSLSLNVPGAACLPGVLNVVAGDGPTAFGGMLGVLSRVTGSQLSYVAQTPTGAVLLTGFNGADMAFLPMAYQGGDGRDSGLYALGDGQYQIVFNGTSLTVAPSLASLDQFLRLLPAGTSACVTETGVASAVLGGVTYVVRPGVVVQHAGTGGTALLAQGDDGYFYFVDSAGRRQTLYPAFLEPNTLLTYLRLIDPSATMGVQLDGTVQAWISGVAYTLVPDLTLGSIAPEHAGENWWQEGPRRYRMRNLRQSDSSQGFTLR